MSDQTLYSSRVVFERPRFCHNYKPNELVKPVHYTGDTEACIDDRISDEKRFELIEGRLDVLENQELIVTYYENINISTGTTGSIQIPTGSTIEEGRFGESGNSVLSTLTVTNQPTFESPKDGGGNVITANLDTSGNYIASDTYPDDLALIYSLRVKRVDLGNLDTTRIIDYFSADDEVGASGFTFQQIYDFDDIPQIDINENKGSLKLKNGNPTGSTQPLLEILDNSDNTNVEINSESVRTKNNKTFVAEVDLNNDAYYISDTNGLNRWAIRRGNFGEFIIRNNLTLSNVLSLTGDIIPNGQANINYTTQSTSTTTGALQVAGGVAVAKNLVIGEDIRTDNMTWDASQRRLRIFGTHDDNGNLVVDMDHGGNGTRYLTEFAFRKATNNGQGVANISYFDGEDLTGSHRYAGLIGAVVRNQNATGTNVASGLIGTDGDGLRPSRTITDYIPTDFKVGTSGVLLHSGWTGSINIGVYGKAINGVVDNFAGYFDGKLYNSYITGGTNGILVNDNGVITNSNIDIDTITGNTGIVLTGTTNLYEVPYMIDNETVASNSGFTYNPITKVLTIDGKLNVSGAIDPTALGFTPVSSNPLINNPVSGSTLWVDLNDNLRYSEKTIDKYVLSTPISGSTGIIQTGNTNVGEIPVFTDNNIVRSYSGLTFINDILTVKGNSVIGDTSGSNEGGLLINKLNSGGTLFKAERTGGGGYRFEASTFSNNFAAWRVSHSSVNAYLIADDSNFASSGIALLHNSTNDLTKGIFIDDGIVTVSNTTESTSTTTGALQVRGGVGVNGNVVVGEDVIVGQNSISDKIDIGNNLTNNPFGTLPTTPTGIRLRIGSLSSSSGASRAGSVIFESHGDNNDNPDNIYGLVGVSNNKGSNSSDDLSSYGIWGEGRGITNNGSGSSIAYGVYGKASGAATNYGGYFLGLLYNDNINTTNNGLLTNVNGIVTNSGIDITTITGETGIIITGNTNLYEIPYMIDSDTIASNTGFTYNPITKVLTIDGKLNVTGAIDPTGVGFTPVNSNPLLNNSLSGSTIWVDLNNNLRYSESNIDKYVLSTSFSGGTGVIQTGNTFIGSLAVFNSDNTIESFSGLTYINKILNVGDAVTTKGIGLLTGSTNPLLGNPLSGTTLWVDSNNELNLGNEKLKASVHWGDISGNTADQLDLLDHTHSDDTEIVNSVDNTKVLKFDNSRIDSGTTRVIDSEKLYDIVDGATYIKQTTSFLADEFRRYDVDSSSNPITITLISNPSEDRVPIRLLISDSTNTITLNGNGNTIEGNPTFDLTGVDSEREILLTWNEDDNNWKSTDFVNGQVIFAQLIKSFTSINTTLFIIGTSTSFVNLPLFEGIQETDVEFFEVVDDFTVRLLKSGAYALQASVDIGSSNNSRTTSLTDLFIDITGTGSNYVDFDSLYGYHRNSAQGNLTITSRRYFSKSVPANSLIQVRTRRFSGGGNLRLLIGSSISIERISDSPSIISPPTITSGNPPLTINENDVFQYQATAIGDNITWSLSNEPVGMTVNVVTGLVEWLNPVAGAYTGITFTATNEGGTDNKVFNLNVDPVPVNTTNLLSWLIADDIAGVDNDPVSVWNPEFGSVSVIQSVVANQPVLGSDSGFKHVNFNVGDFLFNPNVNDGARDFTYIVVFRSTSTIQQMGILTTKRQDNNGRFTELFINNDTDGDFSYSLDGLRNNNQDPSKSLFSNLVDGNWHVIGVKNSNNNCELFDGTNTLNYNTETPQGNLTIGEFRIGGNGVVPSFVGDIREVLFYDNDKTDTQITDTITYLKNKYSIS